MDRIDCVDDARAGLGESPVWSADESCLYWVDIPNSRLHRHDPAGSNAVWNMPETIGSCWPLAGGGVLVALRSGLARFDPGSGELTRLCDLEADTSETRANDGKCDRQGRFWVGTMGTPPSRIGALYRISGDLVPHRVLDGIAIPNALCWNRAGDRMYFADTPEGRVLVFDYDPRTGKARNPRDFVVLDPGDGAPDGATVDAEDGLWLAHYGAGKVVRYAPDGTRDREIVVPATRVASVAFGGPDLSKLFITTGRNRLTPKDLRAQPKAGALFACDPGVRGLVETPFALEPSRGGRAQYGHFEIPGQDAKTV